MKQFGDCAYGVNLTDNYKGWVVLSDLGKLPEFNFYVSEIRTIILLEPDVKSQFIAYLPIRAKIKIISIDNDWAKIDLGDSFDVDYGFIPLSHIIKKETFEQDWISFAEKFLGVPYLWGGRDSLGIDCSSLIQLSIAFIGFNIPRDTRDQIDYFKKKNFFKVQNYTKGKIRINRGVIIFWDGHVGVTVNKNTIIHASGHHNKVVYENLNQAIKRINKEAIIISFTI